MPFTCKMRVGLGDTEERDSQSKREEMIQGSKLPAWINTTRATGCSSFPLPMSTGHASETAKESMRWYNHNCLKYLHRRGLKSSHGKGETPPIGFSSLRLTVLTHTVTCLMHHKKTKGMTKMMSTELPQLLGKHHLVPQ